MAGEHKKNHTKAPERAVQLARDFALKHEDAIRFEIGYAADGETKVDDKGRISVQVAPGSEAAQLVEFWNALMDLATDGRYTPDGLEKIRSGIRVFGSEIRATQGDARVARDEAASMEDRYRKAKKIPADVELTDEQKKTLEQKRAIRAHEAKELQQDADNLIRIQGDLIDVIKALNIETDRGRDPGAPDRGRGLG